MREREFTQKKYEILNKKIKQAIKENTSIENLKIEIPKNNKVRNNPIIDQFAEEFGQSSEEEKNSFLGFQQKKLTNKDINKFFISLEIKLYTTVHQNPLHHHQTQECKIKNQSHK